MYYVENEVGSIENVRTVHVSIVGDVHGYMDVEAGLGIGCRNTLRRSGSLPTGAEGLYQCCSDRNREA